MEPLEVGKNKFIDPNKFWIFMVSYYVSFLILSIAIFGIHYPIFSDKISDITPYFLIHDRFEADFVVTNYYYVIFSFIFIFNIICFIIFPYLRQINLYSIKIIFIFSILMIFWIFGFISFYYSSRFFGEVPTAFIHATWLPPANIICFIFNIENGRKRTSALR